MIHPANMRDHVIGPVLDELGLYSLAAEQLLMLTYIHESTVHGDTHLKQVRGPALGPFQIEPLTHDDVYRNFLNARHRSSLRERVTRFCSVLSYDVIPDSRELAWNLAYSAAICRICYWRVPERLPAAGDVAGMTRYWSVYYNTRREPAKEAQFAFAWNRVRNLYV